MSKRYLTVRMCNLKLLARTNWQPFFPSLLLVLSSCERTHRHNRWLNLGHRIHPPLDMKFLPHFLSLSRMHHFSGTRARSLICGLKDESHHSSRHLLPSFILLFLASHYFSVWSCLMTQLEIPLFTLHCSLCVPSNPLPLALSFFFVFLTDGCEDVQCNGSAIYVQMVLGCNYWWYVNWSLHTHTHTASLSPSLHTLLALHLYFEQVRLSLGPLFSWFVQVLSLMSVERGIFALFSSGICE